MLELLLLLLSPPSPAQDKCGDPEILEQRLDELLMRFTPGISWSALREIAADSTLVLEKYERLSDESAPVGTTKRLDFLPSASEKGRTAYRFMTCFFNDGDVLLGCRPFRGRGQLQVVTDAQLKLLRVGMRPSEVRVLLCAPGHETIRDNGEIQWRYSYVENAADKPSGFVAITFDRRQRMKRPDVSFR